MKEIKAIVDAYHQIDFSKNKAALAIVVGVKGSSYRRTGARMLITDTGEWIGGISGGCLEGDALKQARFAMIQNQAKMVTYDTSEDDPYQIGVGLGCNGIIDVLIVPLQCTDTNNQAMILQECINSRTPCVILTVIKTKGNFRDVQLGQTFNAKVMDDFPIQEITEHLISDVNYCLQKQKSTSKSYNCQEGEVTLFIEVIQPAIHLIIHGGNYDVYPMVKLVKEVGWKVSVICNPLKMPTSLFSMADSVVEKERGETVEIDAYTVTLLMAHDYETDFKNLRYFLKSTILYIGLLGPKKRTEKMLLALSEEGTRVSEQDLVRIASPVGLDIGASNPEEIAIAIIAEIKTFFTGRTAQRLKFREKSIYEN